MTELVIGEISALIAGISAVISFVSCVYNNRQTKKINNINIKSRYFEKIFDDYLIYKIPESRKYIRFDENGKLDDFQKLIDELCNMRKNASFFKYDNNEFYGNLKRLTQDLENYLVDCGNHSFENDEQANVYTKISEKTTKIYGCISNCYLGL